ncbi:MAG: hypothetical protein R3B06_27910 [Kofleriaceae bacterium]
MLRSSRHVLLGVLAAALTTLAAAPPAIACDCDSPPDTVASAKARLGVIALGRIRSVTRPAHGPLEVTLFVTQAWRGAAAGAELTLPVDGSDCGYQLVPGDEALVYAPVGGEVGQCKGDASARVVLGAAMAADLAALGPAASTSTAAPPALQTDELVIADGRVDIAYDLGRPMVYVSVSRATRGATRGERLAITTPVGACAAKLTAKARDRVTVRARRVVGGLVISSCLADTSLKVTRTSTRPRRAP